MKKSDTSKFSHNIKMTFGIIIMCVFIFCFCIFFIKDIQSKNRCTEKITAIVSNIEEDDDMIGQYYPTLKYTVKGSIYTVKCDKTFSDISVGSKIEIKYNPENPQEMFVKKFSGTQLLIGIVFIAFPVFIFVIMLRNTLQYSKRTTAIITGSRTINTDNKPVFEIQIQYTIDGIEYNNHLPEFTTEIIQ